MKQINLIIITLIFFATIIAGCQIHNYAYDGDIEYEKGNYYRAIESYNLAIKENPNDYESRFYLGISYFETEQYDKSKEQNLWLIEHNKLVANAYHELAYAYLNEEDLENASVFINKSFMARKPNEIPFEGYLLAAMISFRNNDYNLTQKYVDLVKATNEDYEISLTKVQSDNKTSYIFQYGESMEMSTGNFDSPKEAYDDLINTLENVK